MNHSPQKQPATHLSTLFSFSSELINGGILFLLMILNMCLLTPTAIAGFNPILIDDDGNHRIWKITGNATSIYDLTGVNLNDGIAPDLVEVGSYSLDYNIQDLAIDNNAQTWALALGTGGSATAGNAYIGRFTENAGTYSYTNITDLGATYNDPNTLNHGKALVWDPDNEYFIYEANPTQDDAAGATFKAFDPATNGVVADPWGTGSAEIVVPLSVNQTETYAQGLTFGSDGTLYAAIGYNPAVILKLERNTQHKLTGNSTMIGTPGLGIGMRNIEVLSFNNNGKLLAISSNGGAAGQQGIVYAIDIATGTPTVVADLDNGFAIKRDWEGIQFSDPVYDPAAPKCFAMTDDVAELYSFDLDINTAPTKVITSMIFNGEGATYRSSDDSIYTFHQTNKGTTNPSDLYNVALDGTATLIKASFLTERAAGAEFIHYADGSERLVVLQHEGDAKILVFDAQDLTNSTPLSTTPLLFPGGSAAQVSSLAINPVTGEILVADDGDNGTDLVEIYSVNIGTGQLTLKTTLTVPGIDAESLAFAEDGELYTENVNKGNAAYNHKIFRIDLSTGNITAVEENTNAVVSGDIEGMSCTGSKILTPAVTTSLTLVTEIINDDGGTNTITDFAISTDAGSVVFNAGAVSGDTTTFTSSAIDIASAGAFNLVAPGVSGYAQTASWWTCSGDGSHALSTTNSVTSGTLTGIVTIAEGDSVTCTVTYDDNASCSALSGSVNVAISPISILKTESGDYKNKLFVATTDDSNNTGNVTAYAIGADELPVPSPSWNAAGAMATQNQRGARLFTSVVSQQSSTLVAFNSASLTNDSFLSSGVPDYQTIKTNVASAAMGRISPNSNITLLQDEVNPLRFLAEPDYRSFYTATISNRSSASGATVPTQVLVTSDDGFLYSFNQSNGDLNWGWMPPSLALELKHAAGFANHHYMQGEIDQRDLKSGSTFASYIIGSYRDGLGQYVLKLNSNSTLASVISDTDHTISNALADTAPNHGKRAYFSDANGIHYMAYIITSSGVDSALHITKLTDGTHVEIALGFTATSTPFVMPDLLGSASPSTNTLYLGSDDGNIYAANLFANDNITINTGLSSAFDSSATPVGAIQPAGQSSSAILYIGASVAVGGNYYLHAQAEDRISLFKYASGTSWNPSWTTSTATSLTGKWTLINGTLTFGTDASITPLPANSRLTDEAYIIANSIVLPVTETSATANACYGDAYYYFYKLPTGYKPVKTFFYTNNHTAITTGKIRVGKGDATRMHLTTTPVAKKLVALGLAGQDVNSATGVSQSFYVNDPATTGIRSWKELH